MDDLHTFDGARPVGPGASGHAHGQAAFLLIESLMHALVAKSTLSREDFIEIVEGAAEVEQELAKTNAPYPPPRNGSLLAPLAAAFKKELGR